MTRKLPWPEYAAEFFGTAFMVCAGLSFVVFDFAPGLPMTRWVPEVGLRRLITGLCFSATGSLVAISPLGKTSGGHINPSVSLAFCLHGAMAVRDFAGYVAAQMLGGIAGAWLLAEVWGRPAAALHDGMTLPGPGLPLWVVGGAEVGITALLVGAIFFFVSSRRLHRWTPLMTWLLVAVMVWLEAPISGTSLNPARSFGPALVAHLWTGQGLYLIAPPLGAVLGWAAYCLVRSEWTALRTGKLFHSPGYRSIFRPERPL